LRRAIQGLQLSLRRHGHLVTSSTLGLATFSDLSEAIVLKGFTGGCVGSSLGLVLLRSWWLD
jgi:hypothetical protein